MANTRADTIIPPNTWVNLYGGSNPAVGTAVDVWNKGSCTINIAISASAPASTTVGVPLYAGAVGYLNVSSGEAGLWAYNPNPFNGYVLVQE